MEEIIYENKYFKLVFRGTLVVQVSKNGMYNDKYYLSYSDAADELKKQGVDIDADQ